MQFFKENIIFVFGLLVVGGLIFSPSNTPQKLNQINNNLATNMGGTENIQSGAVATSTNEIVLAGGVQKPAVKTLQRIAKPILPKTRVINEEANEEGDDN